LYTPDTLLRISPARSSHTWLGISASLGASRSVVKCVFDNLISYSLSPFFDGNGNGLPTSIYQVNGAKKCAIEFCSLSKTAGFTGTRCGYTVIPHELVRGGAQLNKLWLRRQSTKYNGVPYIVQRGAQAVFSDEGFAQVKENIAYYRENARLITDTLTGLGIWYTGGLNSPYVWLKCPGGLSSWQFFDHLLEKANVVGTPGAGFGKNGEGFFRLSAFGSKENVTTAMQRLQALDF
jgi:LL-diaminopimelate aminotransferase